MLYGWCHVTLKITLEGETKDFDDLSDATQEHITKMIYEGYRSIEIVEPEESDS